MLEENAQIDMFGNMVATKPTIKRDELAGFIYENIKDFTLTDLVSCITNKYNEIIEYIDLCNGEKCCQKTSLLFNPHRLDTMNKSSTCTIFQALKNDSWVSGLARATLFKKGKVNELLYQALQLHINGVTYVNEFPPHIARDFAYKYKLNIESKILDPCAGWGGRMIGFSVVSNNYTGFEPASKTYIGLVDLSRFIKGFKHDFNAVLHNTCFEDTNLKENYYDFAMTSPPYYDTELYSDEETQSYKRYKSFEEWVELFYLVMINKTMRALKPNARFVLNIGSRVYPLSQILCDKFGSLYDIKKVHSPLSGTGGLHKDEGAESFYQIVKK